MNYTHEDNLRYFKDVVAQECEVWVACRDRVLVGLMAIAEGKIDQLHVDPEHQGKGVGSALLEKAKSLTPAGLVLFTHQRNQRARVFYERRGFKAVHFGVSNPPESEPDVKYQWVPGSHPAA